MALTEEQAKAYDQLDAAIQNAMNVFDREGSGGFIVGWALVVNSVRSPNDDERNEIDRFEVDDEMDVVSEYDYWTKRGQNPALTRGIIHEFLDEITGGRL